MVAPLRKRIGLFGGSFNPAHEGHVYLSQMALLKLCLDEVWWLVAPKNPLKDQSGLAPFEKRLKSAREIAAGKAIEVLEIERAHGLFYTIDSVRFLKANYPSASFVWIMGADCFAGLHLWKSWRELMALIPMAVFPRPGFTEKALEGPAATAFAKNRLSDDAAQNLVVTTPPAWVYIDVKPVPVSSTEIRSTGKG